MIVDVERKKSFLQWLNQHLHFNRREVYWILNYLLTHNAILSQVVFVENAEQTPRGLKIFEAQDKQEPLELYIKQRLFTDPEQIFHELRMNWKKELYLEISFKQAWQNELYLSVLEDNPYASWNNQTDEAFVTSLNAALAAEENSYAISSLYLKLDQALEEGNRELFSQLAEELTEKLKS